MADIIITPGSSLMSFTSSLNYIQTLTQDSSGNLTLLGSGSTGRTDLFTVNGNSGTLFSVSDDLSNSLFSVNTIAGLPVIEAFANNSVVMGQYGQNVLVVTGSRVGIGTSTPSSELHLLGTSTVMTITDTSYNRTSEIGYIDSANLYLANDNGGNTYIGRYNNIFLAYGGGNVGIGTTSPSARLDIRSAASSGATNAPTLRAFGYDTDSYFEVNNNGNNSADIKLTRSDGATMFQVNGHSGVTYFDGNVGIGNGNPSYKLDVTGDIGVSGAIIDTSNNYLYWNPGESYFYAGGFDANNNIQYGPRQGIASISDRAEMASTWGGESYYNGQVLSKVTANETISRGKLVYLSTNGKWALADAIAVSSTKPLLGIALDNVSADGLFSVLLDGMIITPYHSQNGTPAIPGAPIYVATSDIDAPGYVTQDAPSTAGEAVRLVGHNIYDTGSGNGVIIRFQPDNTWIEL